MNVRMTPEEAKGAILRGECPEGATVTGSISFIGEQGLEELPNGLRVEGELHVQSCHRFRTLPLAFFAESLNLENCASFTGTAPGFGGEALDVHGHLILRNCPSLVHLPDELRVGTHLTIADCPRLGNRSSIPPVPQRLFVGGNVELDKLPSLAHVLEWMDIGGGLWIRDCQLLPKLSSVNVTGDVAIQSCASLARIEGISFLAAESDLVVRDCHSLEAIGDDVHPGRSLQVQDCPVLTKLPSGMKLLGDISLRDCPSLRGWPEGLEVRGGVWCSGNTPQDSWGPSPVFRSQETQAKDRRRSASPSPG